MSRIPSILEYVRANRAHIDRLEKITSSIPTPAQAVALLKDSPGFADAMRLPNDSSGAPVVAATAARALWRKTQFIYAFDLDLYDALNATSAAGELPGDVLKRLPAQSICIEVADTVTALVTLDSKVYEDDLETLTDAIWVTVFAEDPAEHRFGAFVFKLGMSLAASTELAYAHLTVEQRKDIAEMVSDVLACALYLCSEEPDVYGSVSSMNMRRIVRRQHPYGPTICTVGHRVGAAFRKAKAAYDSAQANDATSALSGAGRVPHYRRAHWHTYWVGARGTDERRRVLKWLSPVAVNVREGAAVTAVVHPVKKENPA